jgi:hypothetical protein
MHCIFHPAWSIVVVLLIWATLDLLSDLAA